jgi:PKD repeat protein
LLATTSKVDFSLVQLSSSPPQVYEPFYSGWDRRVVSYLDTVTCIHHPNGSVKKISKSFRRVVTADFGGGYDANTHWKISTWDVGTTEPGSSGSPLFNADHRIVGDLTGGDATCTYNFNDYFQKLSVSWDRYPDSSNQLKYWLDPEQTGALVINGYDPFSGGKPVANFSIRPEKIQVGRKVYVTDLSTGMPNSWKWSFENGTPSMSSLKNPHPVKFDRPGTYHITLSILNELGTDSLQLSVTVSDYADYVISENRIVPERQIELSDKSSGSPASVSWSVPGSSQPMMSGTAAELTFLKQGEYSVTEIVQLHDFTDTLTHYNQISVISDLLAFRSKTISNVDSDEHTLYSKMGSQGYIPGSNNMGITAYAEAFRNPSDTILSINGITIPVELISNWSGNYYLPIVIWDASKTVVRRDSVKITGYLPGSRVTKWLKYPFYTIDTLVYAGFEPKPWDQGTFISKMAVDRGENGKNTAFALKGSTWQPLYDLAGTHTSYGISLETSASTDKYLFENEISVNRYFSDGKFVVDLGKLVFKDVDISVYNINGQKVIADVTRNENLISFQIYPPVQGIYVVRIVIDSFKFPKPFRIIWH